MTRLSLSLLAILWLIVLPVAAGVATIEENDLDPDRVRLSFASHRPGSAGEDLFDRWGIQFQGLGSAQPRVRTQVIGIVGTQINYLSPEDGADQSRLAINFRSLTRQIGLVLRAGSGVTATLTAYDAAGNEIGSVQKTGFDEVAGSFVGLEQGSGEPGISKLRIELDDANSAVEVVELFVTFLTPRPFTTYVAQFADGALPSGGLQTVLFLASLANTTGRGEVRIIGDNGAPLEMEINGVTRSSVEFELGPFGSVSFATSATSSPPVQGYVCIDSNVPVEATAIFRILDADDNPLSEAGVGGSPGRNQMVGAVRKLDARMFDSGVAVANVSDQPADAVVLLLDEDGSTVAENSDFLQLGPGEHTAAFLPSLFPGEDLSDFTGTVLILTDEPLVLVILRTRAGLVLSSLPAGSSQR